MLLTGTHPQPLAAPEDPGATPPIAPRKPRISAKFGERRVDYYAWLREKDDPAVIAYLDAENAYTQAVMRPLEGFRERLYTEMLARIQETDETVPYRRRGYWYYQREVEGQQYPIYCRREGSMEAPEEVLLDVNTLAKGHKYTAVGVMDVSPDGTKLAYSVDLTGFRQYTLHVKDLSTGELLRDAIERVTSIAWAADSRTLFYVEEHATTKRSYRLHRRVVGEPGDWLVYEEGDEHFDIGVGDTRSERFVVLGAFSKDTTEMRILPMEEPEGEFRVVVPRKPGHEYYIDHRDDELFIRTNDKGRNFRLVRAPLADPAPKNWKQVLPHRPLVMLEEVDLFRDFWVAVERDKGLLKLRVTEFATNASRHVAFEEKVYCAQPGTNAEFDATRFRFVYESLVIPRSVYDYDVPSRESHLLKRYPVLGGYDPAEYVSEALTARAKDGTSIPISLVYKKSLRGRGRGTSRQNQNPQPLLLYGYGALRLPDGPPLQHAAHLAPRPRDDLRDRAYPRRRGSRQALVRRGEAPQEEEHLHRLRRLRRVAGSPEIHGARPARDPGRQRGWPSHGRRRQPAS
jgi:oligopeptidase B